MIVTNWKVSREAD